MQSGAQKRQPKTEGKLEDRPQPEVWWWWYHREGDPKTLNHGSRGVCDGSSAEVAVLRLAEYLWPSKYEMRERKSGKRFSRAVTTCSRVRREPLTRFLPIET